MPDLRAALGFRLHTGWAALVAAARKPDKIEILLRRRVELLPADGSVPRFVYHTAAELTRAESAALVKRAAAAAQKTARTALKPLVEMLRNLGVSLEAAGIPAGSTKVPPELEKILAAHPLIHAAEGALFHHALTAACESCGLTVVTGRERDVFTHAADACKTDPSTFRQSLDAMRKIVGPPWSADEKTATAAALLALAPRA